MSWNTLKLLPLALLLSVILAACNPGSTPNKVLSGRVAVYDDNGGWHESAIAAKAALVADGRPVDLVTADDIQNSLSDYGLLVMTGQDPRVLLSTLGSTGRFQIQDLLQRGGGFIGLGVGSYVAADSVAWNNLTTIETTLGLFNGVASGPIVDIAPPGTSVLTPVTPTDNRFNPSFFPTIQVAYTGGPQLVVDFPYATVIGTFDLAENLPAALCFERGAGRVVLFSVNPEFEENSDRDGTNWGSDLNDPESDWFWLQNAARWCLWEQ